MDSLNFKRPPRLRFFAVLLIVTGTVSERAAAQSATPAIKVKDTEPVVHALCGKRVALLGESPVHGFGEALEFKAELVRRLVEQCHYDALFIESGTYDYINIEKKLKSGQDVTDAMISAAIGGLWANREVQSLVPFLREKVMEAASRSGGWMTKSGQAAMPPVRCHPIWCGLFKATRDPGASVFSKNTCSGNTPRRPPTVHPTRRRSLVASRKPKTASHNRKSATNPGPKTIGR